jgi:hypothetical protein
MKTYFIATRDSYGQRTGTFQSLELSEDQVSTNQYGSKTYNGSFLYESLSEVLIAIQD